MATSGPYLIGVVGSRHQATHLQLLNLHPVRHRAQRRVATSRNSSPALSLGASLDGSLNGGEHSGSALRGGERSATHGGAAMRIAACASTHGTARSMKRAAKHIAAAREEGGRRTAILHILVNLVFWGFLGKCGIWEQVRGRTRCPIRARCNPLESMSLQQSVAKAASCATHASHQSQYILSHASRPRQDVEIQSAALTAGAVVANPMAVFGRMHNEQHTLRWGRCSTR